MMNLVKVKQSHEFFSYSFPYALSAMTHHQPANDLHFLCTIITYNSLEFNYPMTHSHSSQSPVCSRINLVKFSYCRLSSMSKTLPNHQLKERKKNPKWQWDIAKRQEEASKLSSKKLFSSLIHLFFFDYYGAFVVVLLFDVRIFLARRVKSSQMNSRFDFIFPPIVIIVVVMRPITLLLLSFTLPKKKHKTSNLRCLHQKVFSSFRLLRLTQRYIREAKMIMTCILECFVSFSIWSWALVDSAFTSHPLSHHAWHYS